MIRRSKVWWVAAVVFTIVNVAGVVYGIVVGDMMHAAGHVVAQLAGYVVWVLTGRSRQESPAEIPAVDERRIEYLQQSVDAIALEVERIGEKQRFSDKLKVEQGKPPSDER